MSALLAVILGSLVSAGVGALGSYLSAKGQKDANQANRELFEQEMNYNSAEAQKNRDFQLMMSNTAHQREVADLKAAGLNPWLSVSGSGASVNSTSSSSATAPSMKNEAMDLSSVVGALNSIKDIALIGALTDKYKSQSSYYKRKK